MMATSLAPGGIPPFPEFLTEATMFVTRPSTIAHAERARREVLVPIYEASQLCRKTTAAHHAIQQRPHVHPPLLLEAYISVESGILNGQKCHAWTLTLRWQGSRRGSRTPILAGSPPPQSPPPPLLAVWQAFGVWQTFCPYPYTLYEEARKPNPKRFPNGLPNSGCSCPKPSSGV